MEGTTHMLGDLGILIMRSIIGALLMGHGSQKLFGWFGGYGVNGTAGWLESLGLRPGRPWAWLAGLGEFGGGLLTALGFLHPVGSLSLIGPMAVAAGTAHAGKPVWVTEGGAELPVTNIALGLGLSMMDPGRLSLDHLLKIKTPTWLIGLTTAGLFAGVAYALTRPPQQEPSQAEEAEAGAELQGGAGASESSSM
jgi:putative oxidoreductase